MKKVGIVRRHSFSTVVYYVEKTICFRIKICAQIAFYDILLHFVYISNQNVSGLYKKVQASFPKTLPLLIPSNPFFKVGFLKL